MLRSFNRKTSKLSEISEKHPDDVRKQCTRFGTAASEYITIKRHPTLVSQTAKIKGYLYPTTFGSLL